MPTGLQLRVARVARGLTLYEAAREAGLSLSMLSRLEHQRARLLPDVEARLMQVVRWNAAFDRLFAELATEEIQEPWAKA